MRSFLIVLLLGLGLCPVNAQSPLDVVILGDSNTWLGGDDCTGKRGWNTWFRQDLHPRSCRSYARSGATWTNTPETCRNVEENIGVLGNQNVIYNQICRLADAIKAGRQVRPNLLIVMAGTNDAWFREQRPQAFSRPLLVADSLALSSADRVLTLEESVRYGCLLLRQHCPDARIVLVTPMQSTAVETAYICQVGDIIERVGNDLSLPVIRLDREGCVSRQSELQQKRFTYDGTHTSEAGAQCIGHLIANSIIHLKPKS